jgi:hypothetical protein
MVNPLKTGFHKRRDRKEEIKYYRHIGTQSVPHRKHYVTATKPNRLMLFREYIQIHCVGRMQGFDILKQVVHWAFKGLVVASEYEYQNEEHINLMSVLKNMIK